MLFIQDPDLIGVSILKVTRNDLVQMQVDALSTTDPYFIYTSSTGRLTWAVPFNVTPGSLASTILSLEKIKVIYK